MSAAPLSFSTAEPPITRPRLRGPYGSAPHALQLEADVHPLEAGGDGGVVGLHHLALELVALAAGSLEVDLAGQLGEVGEQDDAVVANVHEAVVHGRLLPLPVGLADADDGVVERTEERSVVGEEGDVAPADRAADHH